MKLFVATKALILHEGKVLLLREADAYADGTQKGRYSEPGGRLNPGENYKEALLREIQEETGLTVRIGDPVTVDEWRPVVRGEQWQIVGIFFECFANSTEVKLGPDHDGYIWIDPKDHAEYNMAENLHPIFEAYSKRKS